MNVCTTSEEPMVVSELVWVLKQHKHPMTRRELCRELDCTDSALRQRIETARNFGHWIVNDGNGAGYYLAEDAYTILRYYNIEYARAMSILKRLKFVRRFLKKEGLLE